MTAELDMTEATAALGRLAMSANYAHDVRLLRLALEWLKGFSTVTPTVDEWSEQMDAERARQIEHGYDDAHDAQHDVAHLLNCAIDYARWGNNLAAATMARCALRMPRGPITDAAVNEAVDIIVEEILEDESIDSLDVVLAKSAARRILAEVRS